MGARIDTDTFSGPACGKQPLCVLKYATWKKIFWMALHLMLIFVTLVGVFVHSPRSAFALIYVKSVGLLFLLGLVVSFFDMALFKEIRLYEDRIVKAWALLGARELELDKAGLRSVVLPTFGLSKKTLFHQSMTRLMSIPELGRLTGIYYIETMAGVEEAKLLNSLLAHLSGREVTEFEQTAFMDTLIKEGIRYDLPGG